MATWREIIGSYQASFRAVPFAMLDNEHGAGRRLVQHIFPQRDRDEFEDMGRAGRTFRAELVVYGDDYLQQRDRLLAALSTRGSSQLVHPWFGVLSCVVGPVRVRHTLKHGGAAFFDVEFLEDSEQIQALRTSVSTLPASDAAAAAAEGASEELVTTELESSGKPEAVRDAAEVETSKIGKLLLEVPEAFAGLERDVAYYKRNALDLANRAQALVTAPADLAAAVLGAFRAILTTARTLPDSLAAYEALLFELGIEPDLGGISAVSLKAKRNAVLVVGLAERAAIAGAARAAARMEWETLDEAIAARNRLLAHVDRQLEDLEDDDVAQALEELRRSIFATVPFDSEKLPRLQTIQLAESMPSILLGYQLYGDPDQGEAIAARNGALNPALMPAGELRVLVPS